MIDFYRSGSTLSSQDFVHPYSPHQAWSQLFQPLPASRSELTLTKMESSSSTGDSRNPPADKTTVRTTRTVLARREIRSPRVLIRTTVKEARAVWTRIRILAKLVREEMVNWGANITRDKTRSQSARCEEDREAMHHKAECFPHTRYLSRCPLHVWQFNCTY